MYVRKPTTKKQIKPNMNECYYSPVQPNILQMENGIISIISPHQYCFHNHYCIFNKNRTELETQITQLENTLTQFRQIKEAAINGETIYHKGLEDFYNITSSEYIGIDGKTHHKFEVQMTDRFMNALNNKIINLEYDLKNLEYYRRDILHGKIGGYGYEQ